MADRVLFMGWGNPVRGREERALEVFNESVGLYGRMQQEGRIEWFDVTLLSPNPTSTASRCCRATRADPAVEEDEEFQRVITDASLIVEDLSVIRGYATRASPRRWRCTPRRSPRSRRSPERGARRRGGFDRPAAGDPGTAMTHPDHRLVARVVTALAERTEAQGDLLAATLAARWSASDRHEPAAHEWLRRWTPRPAHFVDPRVHLRGGPLPRLQLVGTLRRPRGGGRRRTCGAARCWAACRRSARHAGRARAPAALRGAARPCSRRARPATPCTSSRGRARGAAHRGRRGLRARRLVPPHAFGELAVLDRTPRTATVVAVLDTETVEIGAAALDAVLAAHPDAVRRCSACWRGC